MINFWLVIFFFSLFAIFMNVHDLIYLDLSRSNYVMSVFMIAISSVLICMSIFKIVYL